MARDTFPFLWVPHLVMLLVHLCACVPGASYHIIFCCFGLVFISTCICSPSRCVMPASVSPIVTSNVSLPMLRFCMEPAGTVMVAGTFLPSICSVSCADMDGIYSFLSSVAQSVSNVVGYCVVGPTPCCRAWSAAWSMFWVTTEAEVCLSGCWS